MHHGQGATGGGGGILTADLMNPRSKMKVGTCLGQSAIATTACCSGRSRRQPDDSVTAAREPISVERGRGAPDVAQKPTNGRFVTQSTSSQHKKKDKQKRINQLTTIRK